MSMKMLLIPQQVPDKLSISSKRQRGPSIPMSAKCTNILTRVAHSLRLECTSQNKSAEVLLDNFRYEREQLINSK